MKNNVADKNILVIGGAGYIGTHLVDLLLADGANVTVLDNLMYGEASIQGFLSNRRFNLVNRDATDLAHLIRACKGADAIVHLAGLVGDPACAVDKELTYQSNIATAKLVRDVARGLGIKRLVFASSCSVYGVSEGEVSEESELNPVSLYAQTKIQTERDLLVDETKDMGITILRFATVFGHSRRPRFDLVANLFSAQGMTDGKITVSGGDQWRPFIHVRDLGRAVKMVLEADIEKVSNQIFNVGDSRLNMTIDKVGQIVAEEVKKFREVELVELPFQSDRRNYAVSFNKIKNTLGFSAETLMEQGVREMVENFSKGLYASYKEPIYSNLESTKKIAQVYFNELKTRNLYRPLDITQIQ